MITHRLLTVFKKKQNKITDKAEKVTVKYIFYLTEASVGRPLYDKGKKITPRLRQRGDEYCVFKFSSVCVIYYICM